MNLLSGALLLAAVWSGGGAQQYDMYDYLMGPADEQLSQNLPMDLQDGEDLAHLFWEGKQMEEAQPQQYVENQMTETPERSGEVEKVKDSGASKESAETTQENTEIKPASDKQLDSIFGEDSQLEDSIEEADSEEKTPSAQESTETKLTAEEPAKEEETGLAEESSEAKPTDKEPEKRPHLSAEDYESKEIQDWENKEKYHLIKALLRHSIKLPDGKEVNMDEETYRFLKSLLRGTDESISDKEMSSSKSIVRKREVSPFQQEIVARELEREEETEKAFDHMKAALAEAEEQKELAIAENGALAEALAYSTLKDITGNSAFEEEENKDIEEAIQLERKLSAYQTAQSLIDAEEAQEEGLMQEVQRMMEEELIEERLAEAAAEAEAEVEAEAEEEAEAEAEEEAEAEAEEEAEEEILADLRQAAAELHRPQAPAVDLYSRSLRGSVNPALFEDEGDCPELRKLPLGCPAVDARTDPFTSLDISAELCDRHYVCYQCGSATGLTPGQCDEGFAADMLQICLDSPECARHAVALLSLVKTSHLFIPKELQWSDVCSSSCVQNYIRFGTE